MYDQQKLDLLSPDALVFFSDQLLSFITTTQSYCQCSQLLAPGGKEPLLQGCEAASGRMNNCPCSSTTKAALLPVQVTGTSKPGEQAAKALRASAPGVFELENKCWVGEG